MVARPPLKLTIEAMRLDDLDVVQAIERASFSSPWPPNAYRSELETNRLASYLVVRVAGEIVAYGGMWLMVDEAHITTFAVHPAWRRQRIGERLLLAFLELAVVRGAHEATLEVRLSNLAARRLYEKYGFRPVGLRPRYYSDDNEDALIMTTEPLGDPPLRARMARLRDELDAAPLPKRPDVPTGAPPAGIEPHGPDPRGETGPPAGQEGR
jgi:ribosomal-protein-alanine N-acetyltransferase